MKRYAIMKTTSGKIILIGFVDEAATTQEIKRKYWDDNQVRIDHDDSKVFFIDFSEQDARTFDAALTLGGYPVSCAASGLNSLRKIVEMMINTVITFP